MRARRVSAIAVSGLVSAGVLAPLQARADVSATVYVGEFPHGVFAQCSDKAVDAGSAATPFSGAVDGGARPSAVGFADALAAGPLAVKDHAAILLSDGARLDAATAAEVSQHVSVTAVGVRRLRRSVPG